MKIGLDINKGYLVDEIAVRQNVDKATFWLNILPDPDPVLRKTGKDITAYKDLLSDDHVGSAVTRRKMYVKMLEWQIQPPPAIGKVKQNIPEIDICKLALKNLRRQDGRRKNKIKDIIDQSLNPIFWGYSVFEIVWEQSGPYWLPRLIEEKPREWFFFDNENRLRMKSKDVPEGIPLSDPQFKYRFVVLQNAPTYENPYGDRALSRCFWPVTFKRGGLKFFATFIEKFGIPHIIGKQPRGASKEDAEKLRDKLDMMVQDAVAVVPDDSSIEILSIKESGSGNNSFVQFFDIQNNAISKAILTNVFSTEHQKVGSYSSSKSGLDSEDKLSKSDMDFPADLFNEVFEYIVDLNIGSGIYPVYAPFEEDDAKKDFAERDEKLFSVIKPSKKYISRMYNIPEDEFEIIQNTQMVTERSRSQVSDPVQAPSAIVRPAAEPVEAPGTERSRSSFSSPVAEPVEATVRKAISAQMSVDYLIDSMSPAQLGKSNNAILEPVLNLIKTGVTNPNDIAQHIINLYPDMKTQQLTDMLEKALFVSEIWGRIKNQQP